MKSIYQDVCDKVVSLDPVIRFVGITDEDGTLLATTERKGLKPLLSPEERAQYAITAATRQYTRLRWEYLLGKVDYASSHYAKLIRATIPIADENSRLYYVMLLSFDVESGDKVHNIIMNKVLPIVRKNTSKFMKNKK
ncbi:MAG: hypothetical protein DA330_01105 [Nitrososphaera sp.]|nr:hypothetical protein [Nitrososphaera sp.]